MSIDPLVGRVLAERYRIEERIGEGGMGAVYRAEHQSMHKRLAVKVLLPAALQHDELVQRFHREAIAGAHVDHANVAAAIDFGTLEDGAHFLVLEYLEGRSLREVIAEGSLEPSRAIKIVRQIALGLRAVHALGIVHRDLKPENVMLISRDGDPDFVKLLDFGIAKVPMNELAKRAGASASLTRSGSVYGTPEYMAPEQAAGEDVDARADLYALGVIFYEMLCGSRPFSAASAGALLEMVAMRPPPPLGPRVQTWRLPLGLEALVMRLLDPGMLARTASAGVLLQELDAIDASVLAPVGADVQRVAGARDVTRVARLTPAVVAEPLPARRAPRKASSFLLTGVSLGVLGAFLMIGVAARSSTTLDALEQDDETMDGAPASDDTSEDGGVGAGAVAVAEPTRATDGELDAARAGGLTMLGPLAQKYPKDRAVLKALLLAYAADRGGLHAAMGVAKRLFEVDPNAANDADVRGVVLSAANGTVESSGAAFDLMASQMGAAGPDALYELLVNPQTPKPARDRAQTLLNDSRIRGAATPALLVAVDLRAQVACGRKALFARAKENGDARALPFLKPMQATTGCGFFRRGDCFQCLGSRTELREAIEAIERRASP